MIVFLSTYGFDEMSCQSASFKLEVPFMTRGKEHICSCQKARWSELAAELYHPQTFDTNHCCESMSVYTEYSF